MGFQLGRARAYSSTDCPVDELSDLMGEDSVNNHVAMRIMKINLSLIWVRVEKETVVANFAFVIHSVHRTLHQGWYKEIAARRVPNVYPS